MDNRNLDDLNRILEDVGDKIENMVNQAVNAQDYQELSRNISRTLNRAIDSGGEALKKALGGVETGSNPEHNARAYETHKEHGYQKPPFGAQQQRAVQAPKEQKPTLYAGTTGERVKGVALTVTGGVLSCGMSIGLLVTLLVKGLGFSGAAMVTGPTVVMAAGILGGLLLMRKGLGTLGSLGRFRRYIAALGQNTYCNFEQLSRMVGKSVRYVKKDIKAMIHKGWFLEGHIDRQETCLITSNETYAQYTRTQEQHEARAQEGKAEEKAEKQEEEAASPEVQEVLNKGNAFLEKIRRSNDAIPGVEISEKISRMELIVEKIFERAKEHPEIIPDLKRLMDYYLPTTVKLLDAYEDMDSQPVQGDNIRASKREIEAALDTLNQAFEKLLDSIFRDTAWDVSSDISVLHAMLAQEGLTEDELQKMSRERKEQP